MRHRVLIMSIVLSASLIALPASAGCPSAGDGCDMATDIGVKLEPDVECIGFDIDSNDCTCTAQVILFNDCTADLLAADFSFSRCEDLDYWESARYDCLVIPSGWRGELDLPLDPEAPRGEYDETLDLLIDGETISLKLRYTVSKVSLGGFCGCGAGRAGMPLGASLMLALVALVTLIRKRRSTTARKNSDPRPRRDRPRRRSRPADRC